MSSIAIELPASKSIYNRLLILNELYQLNLEIKNPSLTGDSKLLEQLLFSKEAILNCENAGTVFRFLTALKSVQGSGITLTGSDRMKERPITNLVTALSQLGASITYSEKSGYPPIVIASNPLDGDKVTINGGTSSQFISALAMIGPYLKNGLTIQIEGKVASRPYIEMTVMLMRNLGFEVDFKANVIITKPWKRHLLIKTIYVEPDWSAVAFWFQIMSILRDKKVLLIGLKLNSLQGDAILGIWAGMLGLSISEIPEGISVSASEIPVINNTEWNLSNYPDLAPSLIVLLSVLKRQARFKGLESLKIKESDRTLALQTELKKCNVNLIENDGEWFLDAQNFDLKENTHFQNYNDHRIAMALGCLSLIKPIEMDNMDTVKKSYPNFWEQLQQISI